MPKEALKTATKKRQNNKCALSGEKLPEKTELFDTHRPNPKRNGGTYVPENTTVAIPVEHMKEHGTLRLRTPEKAELKKQIDAREQIIKLRNKVGNQLLAYKRETDELDQEAITMLEKYRDENNLLIKQYDKLITKLIKKIAKEDPLVKTVMNLKGVGPIVASYCITYIDLEKADHASSLWKYVGLHAASHERYEKGISGGGNKRLRSVLWNMAKYQMTEGRPYCDIYRNTKSRLEQSEKITKSRNTQGKLIECAWKDTKPCHRHGAALRAVMKHFLADYWYCGRELSGLPTTPLYPEAILGGGHKTIMPKERGWKY